VLRKSGKNAGEEVEEEEFLMMDRENNASSDDSPAAAPAMSESSSPAELLTNSSHCLGAENPGAASVKKGRPKKYYVEADERDIIVVGPLCPPVTPVKKRRTNECCDYDVSMSDGDAAVRGISPSDAEAILKLYPEVGNAATFENVASVLRLNELIKISYHLYNHSKALYMDDCDDESCFELFRQKCAPQMDEKAKELRNYSFTSSEDAQLVLCQLIRSFVPNLCVHYKAMNKGKSKTMLIFECGSLHFHDSSDSAGSQSQSTCDCGCRCTWKARLETKDNKTFRFYSIDSFFEHKRTCLKRRTRFTSVEVDFQSRVPPDLRSRLMEGLQQYMVCESTYSVRRFRNEKRVVHLINTEKQKIVRTRAIDLSVTNLNLADLIWFY